MSTEDQVRSIWRSADAVCFDVDSTVCMDEAVDELAGFLGVGTQVAQITTKAMGGGMTFQESLKARLDIIKPSRQHICQFITKHSPQLTEGIKDLVDELKKRRIPVYLVTGGFYTIAETVAEELDVPKENIFANKLKFFYNGTYAGFDESQPTCRAGGKTKVMQILKDKHKYQKLVMIGDGVTDMEACPPADAFIGFGGNQVREKVRMGAKWYVTSFQELIDELHRKMPRFDGNR